MTRGLALAVQALRACAARQAGYSLTELLVAMSVSSLTMAAAVGLLGPTGALSQTQPEAYDLQQRLRASADPLLHDLRLAGAGPSHGPAAGSLARYFAPVLPYRADLRASDAVGGIRYRPDAVTLVWLAADAPLTLLAGDIGPSDESLRIDTSPGCPVGDPTCGVGDGDPVLLLDESGGWELVAATSVVGERVAIDRPGPRRSFQAGSTLAVATLHGYWLDTSTDRLMRRYASGTDAPVADHIVGLTFEYLGDPESPASGAAAAPAGGLAPLAGDTLADGPWGGEGGPHPFDMDLLRARVLRVSIRAQAASAAFRGSNSVLFRRPGTSRGGDRFIPDQTVRFDVAPRNLSQARRGGR